MTGLHHFIPNDFGHNGGRPDRQASGISPDQALFGERQIERPVAVHQQRSREIDNRRTAVFMAFKAA